MKLPLLPPPAVLSLALLLVAACSPQSRSPEAGIARSAAASSLNVIHAEGFESGLGSWTPATISGTGSWQALSHPETLSISSDLNPYAVTLADNGAHLPAAEGVSVARFGDLTGTFLGYPYPEQSEKNGGSSFETQSGTLTSPAISLAGVTKAQLEFHSWWEVEGVASTSFDLMQVRVSTDGTNFSLIGQLNPSFAVSQPSEAAYSSGGPAAAPVMRHYLFDLSAYAGQQIYLQFSFDSGDSAYNAFRGFTVDNVVVSGGEALAAPLLTDVSPGVGTAGDLITLHGANFQQGAVFYLNATQIQQFELTQFGVDQAIFQMPSLSPGTYDVRVVNPDGQEFTLTDALVYSASASPAISSLSPGSANLATAQTVTLSGSNFVAGATVQVGTQGATNVNVVSATQATALFPAMEAGTFNVTLTNPSGQSGTLYSAYTVADNSTLQLTAPAGGESLNAGSAFSITWTSSNAAAVDLTLYKGGVFAGAIASSVAASSGSYSWSIPAELAPGADYQVKLATSQGTRSSTSGNFTVVEVTEVVTTTVLTSSPNPSVAGEPVTLTATLTPAVSAGTIQFLVDGSPQGSAVEVVDGQAVLSGVSLPAGALTLTASYSGSGIYLASSASTSHTSGNRPAAAAQSATLNEDTAAPLLLQASDPDGQTLTYAIVDGPAHGSLSGTPPSVTYTPAADFHGSDTFSFKANDGLFDSEPAVVTLTVSPVNDAPVAQPGASSTNEDTSVSITLSAADVDSTELSYAYTQPSNGTLTGQGREVTYQPDTHFFGSDSFTFTVQDAQGGTSTATVTVQVQPVNDAPVAATQSLSIAEDGSLEWTLLASDPEGQPLTFEAVSAPAHGQLTVLASGAATYTPAANFHGTDSFSFRASDPSGGISNSATVTLTVSSVNDAPVAQSQSVALDEDGSRALTLAADDADGDALTYQVVAAPQHGSLSGTPPSVTYTPAANFHGSDSFTFKANDGAQDSPTVTVQVTVNSINDAPLASAPSLTTAEDTAAPIALSATDADGDTLTWTLVEAPAHGALSGDLPEVSYVPAQDFHGTDTFTARVSDGQDELTVSVALSVTAVNDAPLAQPQSASVAEDGSRAITLAATDVDGDALTYQLVDGPQQGVLSGTPPTVTYTPAADFHGSDSFTFKANDGALDSGTVTVQLTVDSINDAPVATPPAVNTAEDTAAPITLTATDADGDTLTWSLVAGPAHGALTGDLPSATYVPAQDFTGSDAFTVRVSDGQAELTFPVSLTVTAVNDAPVANALSSETAEDSGVDLVLTGADLEDSALSFTVASPPANGTLTGTAPNLRYQPDADFNGTDSFTFVVNDGALDSAPATVTLSVSAVNDAPVAQSLSVELDEDVVTALTLTSSDLDGDTLTWTLVEAPAHGTLSGTLPELSYTPSADYHGTDTLVFQVSDGQAESEATTVSLTVRSVNDAPVGQAQAVTTAEDTQAAITLAAADTESDTLSFEVVDAPAHGTLSGTAPELTYSPAGDFHGTDRFTFKANDGQVDSEVRTVTLSVQSANDAPVATAHAASTSEDQAVTFTVSGTDVDGDPVTFRVASPPLHGTLSGTAPDLTYSPNADFTGVDTFTFLTHDGQADSAPATVSITVGPINDAPVAEGSAASTEEDTAVPVPLLATDVDGDDLTYAIISAPQQGTLSGTAPDLTYTPAANFHGADSFAFRANDGLADSEVVTVSLEVGSVDDAPVASPQAVSLIEDMATDIRLHGTDTEGAALTYAVLTPPAHGILSGEAPNLVYRPSSDYAGEDSFTFRVVADGVESAPAVVTITVQGSEDSLSGGGLGCSSTGGALAPGMLAALAGLLLRRGRRWARAGRRSAGPALLALLVAVPFAARAQEQMPRIEAETLRLNAGAADSLVAGAGLLMAPGTLRFALTAHHERDPLVYFRDGQRMGSIVGDRATAHLGLGWAPLSWLELGLQLPVVLMQGGDDLRQYGLAPPSGSSVGTTTVEARAALWQQRHGGLLDLTAGLALQLPLGMEDSVASDAGLGLLPKVGAGRRVNGWLRVGAELGLALRPDTTFDARLLERSTVEAALVAHTVGDGLRGELSWHGAIPTAGGAMRNELLAGARLPVGRWLELYGMGGLGLGRAPGTPTFRLLAGVAVTLERAPHRQVPVPAPAPEPVVAAPDCKAEPAACPEQDLDGDAVANAGDRCPSTPGAVEHQGCEPPVAAEKVEAPCPTETGTRASDRCPAVPLDPPAVAAINQQLSAELKQERMFQVYRAELDAGVTPALDRLVALLQAHPEIVRVQVEGHTDTSGQPKQNLIISQARADSVRNYLLSRGVAPERVTATGYGAARPLTSNDTPEGRETNRRVEVVLGLAAATPAS